MRPPSKIVWLLTIASFHILVGGFSFAIGKSAPRSMAVPADARPSIRQAVRVQSRPGDGPHDRPCKFRLRAAEDTTTDSAGLSEIQLMELREINFPGRDKSCQTRL
jgi:hypothetical protein